MGRVRRMGFLFYIAIWMMGCGAGRAETTFVIANARIYTVDEKQPWAEAVAVRGERILAVGSEDAVIAKAGEGAIVIDLGGRFVLPGFHDIHLHALEAGINGDSCEFPSDAELEDFVAIAKRCAQQQKGAGWVLGSGVYVAGLLDRNELPVDVLDRAIPNRPALILDDLGHGAWANSAALRAVGYSGSSKDPQGGILHRDPATKRLSGIVFENAQQLLRDAARPPSQENLERAYHGLLESLDELNRNGITSISDAGGYWTRGHNFVWDRVEKEDVLSVRAGNALYLYPDREVEEQLAALKALYSNEPSSLLRFNHVKIYVDGILSLGTAALDQPYTVLPVPAINKARGFEYFEPKDLTRYVNELIQLGFQLHFHATGDRGVALALDALEAAGVGSTPSPLRHRITHLYQVRDADWGRFAKLRVGADFQFAPSSVSEEYRRQIKALLGPARAKGLLPVHSALRSGTTTTLSSDWDAGPLSPLGSIQRAVTRRGENRVPDIARAIRMYTLDSAVLLGQDRLTGSIQEGKLADFVVLDSDLFELPSEEIDRVRVLETWLGGELVYQAEDFGLDAGNEKSGSRP